MLKINLKWITDLNTKYKTKRFLDDNIREKKQNNHGMAITFQI